MLESGRILRALGAPLVALALLGGGQASITRADQPPAPTARPTVAPPAASSVAPPAASSAPPAGPSIAPTSARSVAPVADASGAPAAAPTDALAAAPTAVPSGADEGATPDPGDTFRDREDQLALQLGRARAAAGLLPLARSAALDRAALGHARDMAARGYMEHEAPDGSTPASRAASEGYLTPDGSGWLVIEVISAIGDAPENALGWWLSDGVHRRVVLGTRWREVGIGYATGGPYGRFWVADVGCRPNVLPPVLLDGTLAIPDEGCGRSGGTFGPVQAVRVSESASRAGASEWGPYAPQQPWAAGHPALVDLRDAAGHELQARATDPTGASAEAP